MIIAGTTLGKVKTIKSDTNANLDKATASMPVEISGFSQVPTIGDSFYVVEDEKLAKEVIEQRKQELKEGKFQLREKITLENLFNHLEKNKAKQLLIIIKADVQGSCEALKQSLEKLSNDDVKVNVIHYGIGQINESDIMLASTTNAFIIGFNVKVLQNLNKLAQSNKVTIQLYNVIYQAINDVKKAIQNLIKPQVKEVKLGFAEIRKIYDVSNVGQVAGCYITEGKFTKDALVKVIRKGKIIASDHIESLKRFKDDINEVIEKNECGITLSKFTEFKTQDILEAYCLVE